MSSGEKRLPSFLSNGCCAQRGGVSADAGIKVAISHLGPRFCPSKKVATRLRLKVNFFKEACLTTCFVFSALSGELPLKKIAVQDGS